MSGAIGGGKSKSQSEQVNYGSNVWETQSPYLGDLYSQAQGVMNRQMGNVYKPGTTTQRLNPNYQPLSQNLPYGGSNIFGGNAFVPTNFSHLTGGDGGDQTPIYGNWFGQGLNYGQSRNEPQYITETTPGAWESSGQDSPEVAQAKAIMAQMGQQYGQASSALGTAGQYTNEAYNQINAANPNWAQAEGALGGATGYYGNAGNAYGQAQQGFSTIANNTGIDPMADVYARNVGQNFREQIMPELQGQQMMSGGFGGSRGQIGEGLAAARSAQQLQDFNAQLYSDQQNRALAANQGLASVGQGYAGIGQGMTGVGNAYTGIGQGRVNQGIGTGGLGAQQANIANAYQNNAKGLAGIAEMGMNLPWYALQQYQGLLGSPAMRSLGGTGESSSSNNQFSFGGLPKL